MTVQELRAALEGLDPNMPVGVVYPHPTDGEDYALETLDVRQSGVAQGFAGQGADVFYLDVWGGV